MKIRINSINLETNIPLPRKLDIEDLKKIKTELEFKYTSNNVSVSTFKNGGISINYKPCDKVLVRLFNTGKVLILVYNIENFKELEDLDIYEKIEEIKKIVKKVVQ